MREYTVVEESGLAGFAPYRSKAQAAQIASAAALWADLLDGSVPAYLLAEALMPRTPAVVRALASNYPGLIRVSETMTTSDFPTLTGAVLDRMLLGRFRQAPSPWRQFARVATLRDFRAVSRLEPSGLAGTWDRIPENSEIHFGAMGETPYTYTPSKYAQGASVSFEALANDDIGLFAAIPDMLGRGGARTINRAVTDAYVGPAGPDAAVYNAPNGNIITGNPDLDASALALALGQLRQAVDADGEPIVIDEAVLVVPPALEITARSILNATQFVLPPTAATDATIWVENFVGSALSLAVDPYIPIVATANGNTSWFLFASPSAGVPVLEVGFVRGFEEPRLYQKVADTARIGGGIDQEAGAFLTMSQEYKGVIAFGVGVLSPAGTVASNGTNVP